MRLAQWGLKRFASEDVKIMCFGHEDYVSRIYELNSDDGEYKGIGNSEYFRVNLAQNQKDLDITVQ
jgi:hypothetical protein